MYRVLPLAILSALCLLSNCATLSQHAKVYLLEVHNTVRGIVASGDLSPLGLEFATPQAAGLRVFAWMQRLADHAALIQNGTCKRDEVESAWESTVVSDFIVASQRTAVGPNDATREALLNEILKFDSKLDFNRQPIVREDYVRLGCAERECRNKRLLTCVYGSDSITKNDDFKHPYQQGKPCSKCPPGNNFCMNGVLCARASQCTQSKSRCTCLVRPGHCARQGQYDARNCRCSCGLRKTSGLYCQTPCVDNDCPLKLTAEERKEEKKRPNDCFNATLSRRFTLVSKCRLTCNFCRDDAFLKLKEDPVPINMYAKLRFANLE